MVVDPLAEETREHLALIGRELGGDQKLSEIPVEVCSIANEVRVSRDIAVARNGHPLNLRVRPMFTKDIATIAVIFGLIAVNRSGCNFSARDMDES